MGGRGGSSKGGIGRGGSGESSRPSYISETDKAVKLSLSVEDYDLGTTKTRDVWIPKSQLDEQGRPSQWITQQKAQEFYQSGRNASQFGTTFKDAGGREVKTGATKSERERATKEIQRYQSNMSKRDGLFEQAKSLGIKTSSRMKSDTLREKIEKKGEKPVN